MAETTIQQTEPLKVSSFGGYSKEEYDKLQKQSQEPIQEATPIVEPVAEPIQEQKSTEPQPKPTETTQPFSFENEESEKIFNLLKEGKSSEVRSILNEQYKLSNLDSDTASDIIKLNLKYQNPEFSDTDINSLYEEKYELPEKPDEPSQRYEESDEAFAEREAKYQKDLDKYNKKVDKLEKQIARDSKLAKTELSSKLKEIKLPDIQKPEPIVDTAKQEALDAEAKFMEAFDKSLPNILSLKGFETEYESEGAKVPIKFDITQEETKALVDRYKKNPDMANEVVKRWFDKEGNFLSENAASDIYILENFEAIKRKLVSEAANSALKNRIQKEKNIDYSGNSNATSSQPSEQDLIHRRASHFFKN